VSSVVVPNDVDILMGCVVMKLEYVVVGDSDQLETDYGLELDHGMSLIVQFELQVLQQIKVKIQQANNFDLVAFEACEQYLAEAFDPLFEAY
jgi:hypothetical protein